MFTSEAYTLQYNTTIDGQIITAGELVAQAQYLCSKQVDTNWYWNQQTQQHVITVSTRTILHPQLGDNAVTDFHKIPTSICTRTEAKQSTSRKPIRLPDSEYDYIFEEIVLPYKI